jgi:glutamate-1-semialdehyde 2,1-aminomutase
MNNTSGTHVMDDILSRYVKRTPQSSVFGKKARQRLPGGDTRSITFFKPYPTYMAQGAGCRLTDVDGYC